MASKGHPPQFVHLRVFSSYSLLEGAIQPKQMVDLCYEHRMPAVAITDRCNLFGSMEFSDQAASRGIKPLIGCTLTYRHGNTAIYDDLPVFAKNEAGYYNLLSLASQAFLNTDPTEKPHVSWQQVSAHKEGLIFLTGGTKGTLGRLLLDEQLEQAQFFINQLNDIAKDHLYIEITRHGTKEEIAIEAKLLEIAKQLNIPIVATNHAYFPKRDMFEAHDALCCIASGVTLGNPDRTRLNPEYHFASQAEMVKRFADLPEALENTLFIAKRCSFKSPSRKPLLPHFPTEANRSEADELRYQAHEGLNMRLKQITAQETTPLSEAEREARKEEYTKRLEFELDTIISMNFPGYFLIVSDFIRYSKREHIPVGPGRGSGAGSLVAWSLEITDLDPIRFGLLFERFLNPERVSMPDFDIDFCQERRDEVIQYVQQKYGVDKVAQIITFGKLQARAVLRDVGRVLDMPYGQVDRICKLVPNNPASPVTLQEAVELEPELKRQQKEDQEVATLIEIALKLEGLNRHASTHAAGVVIADRPLTELVPLYRDPRSSMPVTQYSMKYVEKSGLVKFDFLGLKTLTVIQYAVSLLKNRGIDLDISTLPLDDQKTFEMLAEGDSAGVFQLESAGMRDTLRKMKPDRFEELIALISLYRPGPMDNIPTYIACKHGEQQPDYLHPSLEPILKETFGVMIYQEQVMEIAKVLSGYTLGGADLLRRAMGKKIKAEMDEQREIFVKGAVAQQVNKSQAEHIFDLVAKFAGYGFNKSHAAAYALISYQTAYLKANFPVEFYVASMNLDIHDTDKLNLFVQEARKHHIDVLPPDINQSEAGFSVETQGSDNALAIRYALGGLKQVGLAAMKQVALERRDNGAYQDIFDFAARLDPKIINKKQCEGLSRAGAFDSVLKNRKACFTASEILSRYNASIWQEKNSNQVSLFDDQALSAPQHPKLYEGDDWLDSEKKQEEFNAFGYYFLGHPLDNTLPTLAPMGYQTASSLAELAGNFHRVKLAGIVTAKRIKSSNRGRYAFVQLSDPTGVFEVSLFNEALLDEVRPDLDQQEPFSVIAELRREEGGERLIVEQMQLLDDCLKSVRCHLCIKTYTLPSRQHLSQFQQLIQDHAHARGNYTISLILPIEQYQKSVAIQLPARYLLTQPIKESIKKTLGSELVIEESWAA